MRYLRAALQAEIDRLVNYHGSDVLRAIALRYETMAEDWENDLDMETCCKAMAFHLLAMVNEQNWGSEGPFVQAYLKEGKA